MKKIPRKVISKPSDSQAQASIYGAKLYNRKAIFETLTTQYRYPSINQPHELGEAKLMELAKQAVLISLIMEV